MSTTFPSIEASSNVPFFVRIRAIVEGLFEKDPKREAFRQIVRELNATNDRDLGELGINRDDIRRCARIHVYGQ